MTCFGLLRTTGGGVGGCSTGTDLAAVALLRPDRGGAWCVEEKSLAKPAVGEGIGVDPLTALKGVMPGREGDAFCSRLWW